MTVHLYTDVIQFVDTTCATFITDRVQSVASAIAPAAYTLLGVYVMLWGLASMRGLIQEPIMEAATRLVKIAFIFGVAMNLGTYNQYVIDTAWNGPQQLAQAFSGLSSEGGIAASQDQLLAKGFDAGAAMWRKGGILDGDFGMYLTAFVAWGITLAVTAYTCFLLALSKIALSLLIGLGPAFIISLLFHPTSEFFNAWVKQIANFGVLLVLVVGANSFIVEIFSRYAGLSAVQQAGTIDVLIPFVATGLISVLVLVQVPHIAAGLAGGISLSSYGLGRFALGKVANLQSGRARRSDSQYRERQERREPRSNYNSVARG